MRILRIIISLIAMAVPTWALIAGYDSVFVRMQILTALLSGVAVCLVFWALVTLIYGRIYCSTVCPLGTMMDCVSASSRVIRRKGADYRFRLPSKRTRIFFLLLAIASLMSGTALITTILDPYSAYARIIEELVCRPLGLAETPIRFAIASLSVAVLTLCVVVLVAWRNGRLLCNTVCPIGIVLGYGSARSYFHMEINPDTCTNCGKCEAACKAQCIKLPEKIIDDARCVVCFDCAAACPCNALTYKSGRHPLGTPLMQKTSTSPNPKP